jgi:hypothetical protein
VAEGTGEPVVLSHGGGWALSLALAVLADGRLASGGHQAVACQDEQKLTRRPLPSRRPAI